MSIIQKVGIAAIVKNEAPYLLEWIAYHREIGVTKFFIADNNSDDGTSEILDDLQSLKILKKIDFPHVPGSPPQIPAYAELIAQFGGEVDWLAFIDADEFLVLDKDISTISEMMMKFDVLPDVGSVAVNWAVYGSSGLVHQSPGLVIERFQCRGEQEWQPNRHYKSIVKPSSVVGMGDNPHYFLLKPDYSTLHVDGASVEDQGRVKGISQRVVWDGLRLNHYVIKSKDEFVHKKKARGRATTTTQVRDDNFFIAHDRNDIIDPVGEEMILNVNKAIDNLKRALSKNSLISSEKIIEIGRKLGKKAQFFRNGEEGYTKARSTIDSAQFDGENLTVKGWCVLPSGDQVPHLWLKIEDELIPLASIDRIIRPDVVKAIPGIKSDLVGYSIQIHLTELPTSFHAGDTVGMVGGEDKDTPFFLLGSQIPASSPKTGSPIPSYERGHDVFDEISGLKPRPKLGLLFDVGANIGQTVRRMRSRFPNAKIVAFEPVGSTFGSLVENVGSDPKVECHNIAVTKSGESFVFIENEPFSVDNRVLSDAVGSGKAEKVPCISGDEFCSRAGIEHIDFLKIDTEGHEIDVISGFQRMLRERKISFIQTEVGMNKGNKKHIYLSNIISYMEDFGYNIFGIYEQVRELDNGTPLRRADIVFASPLV